jgi:hypothetical protein
MRGDLPWNGLYKQMIKFCNEAQLLYQDERLWLQAQKMELK